ncbi:MAG: hypothetical protein EOP83_09695 [Verrucomicrobiaceae bacterium]|nr:MAG: hypothetical protein EOP83_09695 [Verrucomicrobiaceae bacterium]
MDKQTFEHFVATGELKTGKGLFTPRSELTAAIDLARDEILTLRSRGSDFTNSADAEKLVAQMKSDREAREAARAGARPAPTPETKPAAITTPTPAAKPATVAPATIKPALPAGSAMTAAQFRASVAKPTMTRAEFEKLSHPERNEFFRAGGKLSA